MSDDPPAKPARVGKTRLVIPLLIFLALGFFGAEVWVNREPSYQGKTLTKWLQEISTNSFRLDEVSDLSTAKLTDEQEKERKAILAMGTNAVPYLVRIVQRNARPPNSRDVLMEKIWNWLYQHTNFELFSFHKKDYSDAAAEALFILGPLTRSAIPDFVEMLKQPGDYSWAGVFLLSNAGTDSIPALTNLLFAPNPTNQLSALITLGDLGKRATNTLPLIASFLRSTNRELFWEAIMVLGEMGDAARPFFPRFEELLQDTNYALPAAFAMTRLGDLRPLALELTNHIDHIRRASLGGLLELVNADQSDPHFYLKQMFYRKRIADLLVEYENDFHWLRPLTNYLANPDPVLRATIAERLANRGVKDWPFIPALSHALSDADSNVRQKAAEALKKIDVTLEAGGIIRGPRRQKKLVLEFTGHTFAEGGETILHELAAHHAKASFFLTGDFLRNPDFTNLTRRIFLEGHYLGPHSDKHLLYCPWDGPKTNLVTENEFDFDLTKNLDQVVELKQFLCKSNYYNARLDSRYWLPAFEWYNQAITDWSFHNQMILVNYTPGTRSNADYTEEKDPHFVSSQAIFDSIVKKEHEDPYGLNGFLLLMHLGAGPGRTDKFATRFGELLDYLSARGYQFVRIDELMEGK